MKHWIATLAAVGMLATPVWAHEAEHGHTSVAPQTLSTPKTVTPVLSAHVRQDIERHEGMARAHANAAQCLAQGQAYETCQKQLQTQCKGLALGKNCGMRHAH